MNYKEISKDNIIFFKIRIVKSQEREGGGIMYDIGDKILLAGMGLAFACLGICAVIATLSEAGCL